MEGWRYKERWVYNRPVERGDVRVPRDLGKVQDQWDLVPVVLTIHSRNDLGNCESRRCLEG